MQGRFQLVNNWLQNYIDTIIPDSIATISNSPVQSTVITHVSDLLLCVRRLFESKVALVKVCKGFVETLEVSDGCFSLLLNVLHLVSQVIVVRV